MLKLLKIHKFSTLNFTDVEVKVERNNDQGNDISSLGKSMSERTVIAKKENDLEMVWLEQKREKGKE